MGKNAYKNGSINNHVICCSLIGLATNFSLKLDFSFLTPQSPPFEVSLKMGKIFFDAVGLKVEKKVGW